MFLQIVGKIYIYECGKTNLQIIKIAEIGGKRTLVKARTAEELEDDKDDTDTYCHLRT